MKKLLKFILAILLIGATASVLITHHDTTAPGPVIPMTEKNG